MITHSKLSNQPENKLTTKFQPIEMDDPDPGFKKERKGGKKKWLTFVLLPLLMVAVAGGTFGIIKLVSSLNAGGEVASEGGSENSEEPEPTEEPPIIDDNGTLDDATLSIQPITKASSNNPTIQFGRLMLVNPNFTVEPEFIAARKGELVSLSKTYGISEYNAGNGDNLLDPEAAQHLNQMLSDYTIANPGHTMQTVSCFREVGTKCGRLCFATGTSDHHTGLTCDLIDPSYGTSLDTNDYANHTEWQWLKENSYKYGFIDRFPEAWAGGSMDEPVNVNAEGTTGLYETWHYRYVGEYAAREIATGLYNDGQYDSLEHYLKMRGLVPNLLNN